jgi:hypothetical protein
MPKLCLILTGEMRTYNFKRIIESYHRYLSCYEIDLYLFTWKTKGYSNSHGNPDLNKSQNDYIEESEIHLHYSQFPFITLKKIIIDDFTLFRESLPDAMKKIYTSPFRNHSSVTTSIPIEYKYQQSVDYLSSIDHSVYPIVLLTRPDMEIISDLPILNPLPDTLYYNHPCKRCMDHAWVGTPDTLIKQLRTIYTDYLKTYAHLTDRNDDHRDNNEHLLYHCWINHIEVKVKEILFCNLIYFRDVS